MNALNFRSWFRVPLVSLALVLAAGVPSWAGAKAARDRKEMEAATRLQIFLDRAQFAPGKIDGRYGEFTLKALALYREAQGSPVPPEPAAPESGKPKAEKSQPAPDVQGLDLASIDPVFTTYTVTEADLKAVGTLPGSIPAQAKQKSLPYQSAAEAVAEKFHCDLDFLGELNSGKTKKIKAGDQLTVPNVEPFELTEVKDLKAGSEIAANDVDEEPEAKSKAEGKKEDKADAAGSPVSVTIDTKSNMLAVREADKLIAAYPVTIGSAQTESPIGDWTVRAVAKMPNFRYDKAMLNEGKRSGNFHILPPGPNNPVGVVWIQLNKKGIGLHGTSDPDAIGRNASHGCIRLANWDVVRLAAKVKAGVPVSIH